MGLSNGFLIFQAGHCVSNNEENLSAGHCNKRLYQFINVIQPLKGNTTKFDILKEGDKLVFGVYIRSVCFFGGRYF